MSAINLIAENYSVFHKSLIFFMRLAWRSRITLPYLIIVGFLMLDIRMTLEIIIDIEHQTPDGTEINQGENDSDSEQDFEIHSLTQ